MEDKPPYSLGGQLRRAGGLLLDIWQVIIALFALLIVLGQFTDTDKLKAPGAPVVLFWVTAGVGILVALAHVPYSFHRWSRSGRVGAYAGLLTYLALRIFTEVEIDDAWARTPQGVAEAKQESEYDRRDAELQKVQRETDAVIHAQEAERTQEKAARDKLEDCFSFFGHRLPKLEDQVRDGLGNPDSFKHVSTNVTGPDSEGYNVTMTFRAQNRMGALWTYTIRAKVDPGTCSITDESEPQSA